MTRIKQINIKAFLLCFAKVVIIVLGFSFSHWSSISAQVESSEESPPATSPSNDPQTQTQAQAHEPNAMVQQQLLHNDFVYLEYIHSYDEVDEFLNLHHHRKYILKMHPRLQSQTVALNKSSLSIKSYHDLEDGPVRLRILWSVPSVTLHTLHHHSHNPIHNYNHHNYNHNSQQNEDSVIDAQGVEVLRDEDLIAMEEKTAWVQDAQLSTAIQASFSDRRYLSLRLKIYIEISALDGQQFPLKTFTGQFLPNDGIARFSVRPTGGINWLKVTQALQRINQDDRKQKANEGALSTLLRNNNLVLLSLNDNKNHNSSNQDKNQTRPQDVQQKRKWWQSAWKWAEDLEQSFIKNRFRPRQQMSSALLKKWSHGLMPDAEWRELIAGWWMREFLPLMRSDLPCIWKLKIFDSRSTCSYHLPISSKNYLFPINWGFPFASAPPTFLFEHILRVFHIQKQTPGPIETLRFSLSADISTSYEYSKSESFGSGFDLIGGFRHPLLQGFNMYGAQMSLRSRSYSHGLRSAAALMLNRERVHMDLVLDRYESCLAIRLNPAFIEHIELKKRFNSQLKASEYEQLLSLGLLLCSGQEEQQPLVVHEVFDHYWQPAEEVNLHSAFDYNFQRISLSMRGELESEKFLLLMGGGIAPEGPLDIELESFEDTKSKWKDRLNKINSLSLPLRPGIISLSNSNSNSKPNPIPNF